MSKNQITSVNESLDSLSRKGTCIEFFSAYQDLDLDRMLSLCDHQGIVDFVPLGDAVRGRIAELGKQLWGGLMECFPNLDNTVMHQLYNETDDTVTCTVNIFGTQKNDFAGIPSKGNDFESEHIFIFRFNSSGQITHIRIEWDHDSFVQQLSA
jgi:hypothetical protein